MQSKGLPTAVTIVTHEELERTNTTGDASALFRRVPGVMAHVLNQGDVGNAIKMRGFASASHGADVAVYIDGAAQNIPSAAISHGMNDMSWLSLDMIERVEVIKGPASALYGDQSRAGAVNIITRTDGASLVRLSGGSYGQRAGSVVLSASRGSLHSLLVADANALDGFRAQSASSRVNLFLKESLDHRTGRYALRGMFQKSDWNAPGFLSLNALRTSVLQPTDRDTTSPLLNSTAKRGGFVVTRVPIGGERGLFVTLYGEDYHRRRPLGASLKDLNVQEDTRHFYGARLVENVLIGTRASIAFGADTRLDRGDAVNRRSIAGTPSATYSFNQKLDLLTYGLFAQAQYKPFRMLKLLAGARRDAFDYTIGNRKLPAASLDYRQSVGTPHFGAVFTPLPQLEIFVNRGQGFRSPGQAELSPGLSAGPLGAAGGRAFPDLKPPVITSRDGGVTAHLLNSRLHLTAERYNTTNQGEISLVSPGVYASIGDVTRDGYELDAAWAAGAGIDAYASYGKILQARIKSAAPGTSNRVIVPENTAKAGMAYTHAVHAGAHAGLMLLNADVGRISGLPFFSGSPLALGFTDPHTRYDMRASYRWSTVEVTAFATAQGSEYASESISATAAEALIDPRPPHQIGLSLTYRIGRSRP